MVDYPFVVLVDGVMEDCYQFLNEAVAAANELDRDGHAVRVLCDLAYMRPVL